MKTKSTTTNVIDTNLSTKSRRKAVKIIVGGLTTLAAYNVLPAKWGTPIIEQIFLPAHAATSVSQIFTIHPVSANITGGNLSGTIYFTNDTDTSQSYDIQVLNETRGNAIVISYSRVVARKNGDSNVYLVAAGIHQVGDTLRIEVEQTGHSSSMQYRTTIITG